MYLRFRKIIVQGVAVVKYGVNGGNSFGSVKVKTGTDQDSGVHEL